MQNSIWHSRALVFSQLLLIALIVSPLDALWQSNSPRLILSGAFIAVASGIAVWALICMRIHTFSIMPEPVPGGTLTTEGPYRFVRHPMYSAVLLGCLGAAIAHQSVSKWLFLAMLLAVLLLKIHREERLLNARFPGYASYTLTTAALMPMLY